MPLKIESIDHIQVTVPKSMETAAMQFYGTVLGLKQIEKPEPLRKNGGAWYRHGAIEVHVSSEEGSSDHGQSKRHICYVVPDLKDAESELMGYGVEIIPDRQPIEGWTRFYIRDPGGNRIEIAQRVPRSPANATSVAKGPKGTER
jgi:catechol 2,3-dioxygenase-like lactoylglutathione lyase family enzyme